MPSNVLSVIIMWLHDGSKTVIQSNSVTSSILVDYSGSMLTLPQNYVTTVENFPVFVKFWSVFEPRNWFGILKNRFFFHTKEIRWRGSYNGRLTGTVPSLFASWIIFSTCLLQNSWLNQKTSNIELKSFFIQFKQVNEDKYFIISSTTMTLFSV